MNTDDTISKEAVRRLVVDLEGVFARAMTPLRDFHEILIGADGPHHDNPDLGYMGNVIEALVETAKARFEKEYDEQVKALGLFDKKPAKEAA